jgi:hypothetical protein
MELACSLTESILKPKRKAFSDFKALVKLCGCLKIGGKLVCVDFDEIFYALGVFQGRIKWKSRQIDKIIIGI